MYDTGRGRSRRRFIAGAGAAAIAGLAGCSGGGGVGDGMDGGATASDGGGSDGMGETPDPQSLDGHPAAADISAQPRLGVDPFEATAVIVAFEDPSCSRCRVFEQETVPKIRSELVDPGDAAFVFRGYPVVYPWGKPATQALESTFARDASAFWALSNHYFAEQRQFDTNNVLELTREFLASETSVDADAVVADAELKSHDAAVQADLSAGRNAGAGGTTPSVFLFRDGEYRTKAAGSVSFDVVKNALGI